LSLDEHKQPRCDLVTGRDEKFPTGADDAPFGKLIDHVCALADERAWLTKELRRSAERITGAGMDVK
jgi:hypothetical protein